MERADNCSERLHHAFVAALNLAEAEQRISDLEASGKVSELELARTEADSLGKQLDDAGIKTRLTAPDYYYTIALIRGSELWIKAPADRIDDLKAKLQSIREDKQWL